MDKEQSIRFLTIIKLLFIHNGWKKAEYLKKKKIFHSMGQKCYYHPFKLPAEPHLVSIGNNVFIGTNVTLITHNMACCVFHNKPDFYGGGLIPECGTIEIGNNVFIGANATIMYGVKIEDDCIIAANAVVTKDIKEGSVVAGIPAKQIGTFKENYKKCVAYNKMFKEKTDHLDKSLWEKQKDYFWN